jgi:hypothetical protein
MRFELPVPLSGATSTRKRAKIKIPICFLITPWRTIPSAKCSVPISTRHQDASQVIPELYFVLFPEFEWLKSCQIADNFPLRLCFSVGVVFQAFYSLIRASTCKGCQLSYTSIMRGQHFFLLVTALLGATSAAVETTEESNIGILNGDHGLTGLHERSSDPVTPACSNAVSCKRSHNISCL